MLELQIDRLSDEERQVLELASLESIGRTRFAVVPRAAIGGLEPEAFEEVCEDLSRRHFILHPASTEEFLDGTISSCYEFVHALYREVCYRRIVPGRRAKLHQRLGEWAETHVELAEGALWLAEHFEQSGDWPRAIKYLQLAAETASRRFEPRQAAEILQHALELVNKLSDSGRAEDEIKILERLATIYLASLDSRAIETCEALISRAAQYGLVDVEVCTLIEMAWPLLYVSPTRCLNVLQRALQLTAEYRDPLLRERTVMSWSVCNVWAGGWDAKYAEDCARALDVIRQQASRSILGSNLIDYSSILFHSSKYRAAFQNAVEGLAAISQEFENNPYLNSAYQRQIFVPFSLLFLGEWGEALHAFEEAAATMDRNGSHHLAQSYRLFTAWVHSHGLDFAGAVQICEPILALLRNIDEYQVDVRSGSILMASAEVNLGNYERAQMLLTSAEEDMERLPACLDWYWRMLLESSLTELWLAKGDAGQARRQAEKLLTATLRTADRTWQALAWEVSARVAMAELDLTRAKDCIAKGLSATESFEVPLAVWRVHATASELYQNSGDRDLAQHHLKLSCDTIMKLANSLPPENPLRQTFLSTPIIRNILGKVEAPRLRF
jgi:tetratricopeptide (TPR) repeat protein